VDGWFIEVGDPMLRSLYRIEGTRIIAMQDHGRRHYQAHIPPYKLAFAMIHGGSVLWMLMVAKVNLNCALSQLRELWRLEHGPVTLS